jgi:hypothetical protein
MIGVAGGGIALAESAELLAMPQVAQNLDSGLRAEPQLVQKVMVS